MQALVWGNTKKKTYAFFLERLRRRFVVPFFAFFERFTLRPFAAFFEARFFLAMT